MTRGPARDRGPGGGHADGELPGGGRSPLQVAPAAAPGATAGQPEVTDARQPATGGVPEPPEPPEETEPPGETEPPEPPEDPDAWTDEQWLDWLRAGDAADGAGSEPPAPRRRPTRGGLLGNAMLGLAEAIYGPQRPKVVVEAEVPGDLHDDDLDLRLDPEHPELSVVFVRRRTGRRPGRGGAPPGDLGGGGAPGGPAG